jgi:hypothetical protein
MKSGYRYELRDMGVASRSRQSAVSRRQKAEGRKQKAVGEKQMPFILTPDS